MHVFKILSYTGFNRPRGNSYARLLIRQKLYSKPYKSSRYICQFSLYVYMLLHTCLFTEFPYINLTTTVGYNY